jgi:hypothetical protein
MHHRQPRWSQTGAARVGIRLTDAVDTQSGGEQPSAGDARRGVVATNPAV